MIPKTGIVSKISSKKPVTSQEVGALLKSTWHKFKSWGIQAAEEYEMAEHTKAIARLAFDKNEIIASDAIECLWVLDKEKAVKLALKLVTNKNRYILASCLFVLGECGDRAFTPYIKKIEPKYSTTIWRKLGFLEYLYKIEKKEKYLAEIISILNKTADFHTQCAAINILEWISNKKNKRMIKAALIEFSKRELPVRTRSTLEWALKEI